jgi:hypothetical protein
VSKPIRPATPDQRAKLEGLFKALQAARKVEWGLSITASPQEQKQADAAVAKAIKAYDAFAGTLPQISALALRRRYGPRAVTVLTRERDAVPCLVRVDASDGEPRRRSAVSYAVVSELPTPEAFRAMERTAFTSAAEDLVSQALGEIESLAEELRSWFDNMPESFQQADKGQAIDEAAQALEDISSFDPDALVAALPVVHLPDERVSSRSDRACEAAATLRDVQEAAEAAREALTAEIPGWVESDGTTSPDAIREALSELEQQCGDVIDTIEGVEFPGMY